jgi:hypothetical protein
VIRVLVRELDGSLPEGRLADLRRPFEHERGGRTWPIGEELRDHPEFALPAKHSRRRPHTVRAILAEPAGPVDPPDSHYTPDQPRESTCNPSVTLFAVEQQCV